MHQMSIVTIAGLILDMWSPLSIHGTDNMDYWFGYIPDPKGGIIGLSKVARIVDYHSAKLQIQERLVHDIVEHIWEELTKDGMPRPVGMGLVMEGEHLCKTMRGVKKKGGMKTTKLKQAFLDNPIVRTEFLNSIK